VGTEADLARFVSAIPPDLVAAASRAVEKVACGEVLDHDVVGLENENAVAAEGGAVRIQWTHVLVLRIGGALDSTRLGAIDHDTIAIHSSQMQVGSRDVDGARGDARLAVPLLVVVTRGYEDPVTGIGGVDRGLDGFKLSSDAPESPHPQDAGFRLARRLAAILLLSEPWRAARWSLPPVSGLSAPLGEDRCEEGNEGEAGELAYPVTP